MAGGSTILEFQWDNMPNPADYNLINPEPWHFCLLARVLSDDDPMTFPETADLNGNVKNNNNIVWINVTIVDELPGMVGNDDILPGGVVAIGNVYDQTDKFDFEFLSLDFDHGKIYEEAEIRLTLDESAWQKWNDGGRKSENIVVHNEARRQLSVTQNNAWLRNLSFGANELNTMHVSFNFLIRDVSNHPEFDYHVVQRRTVDQKIIGGEKYRIVKPNPQRQTFVADGGSNESISKDESVELSASSIGEPAIYNWYDSNGTLLYTGQNITVSPEFTEKYKLEIIAENDGYKDYDEVTVSVKQYEITSISPNPVINNVTVVYDSENATSGYLQILSPFGTFSSNYIIDVQQEEITIDISSYASGVYSAILVIDGVSVDSQNLLKQ